MFSVSTLLEHLNHQETIEIKKLEKILKLTKKNDRKKLDIAINALKKLGVVVADNNGNVKRNIDQTFHYLLSKCHF